MKNLCSSTMLSNLYTMQIASGKDARQSIPETNQIPNLETRILRARLIYEEAMETIGALGIEIRYDFSGPQYIQSFVESKEIPNLEDIIDGCIDTIYVCTGTLAACGTADLPHLKIVNEANNAKFPNGIGTLNEHGKYQKPENWKTPWHLGLFEEYHYNLKSLAEGLVKEEKEKNDSH